MADIGFPSSSKGLERLPKTRQILKNCWNTGESIVSRPGITSLSTQTGLSRGAFVWNENLYALYGTTLYRMGTDGAATSVGTISGSGGIATAIGFNEAAIVVREAAGLGYTLDASESLTQITDSDFVASNSVTHINGRFVYIPFNGDPAFFSDVGAAGTIDPLSFFDAEELPDKNKVAFNWRNVLIIGGTDSFELFRDVGTGTVPFTRLNARIDFGYIGGLTQYADSYAFVGREINQDVGIYILNQGTATKISNDHVDLILSEYAEAELANAIGARFKWRGFDILTFTLGRHALGFYSGWFDLDTRVSGVTVPWRAGFITHYQQNYYTSRASDFGRLDKVNTDYGNPFERLIETGFYQDGNSDFTAQSIELGISQGYNPAIQTSVVDQTKLNLSLISGTPKTRNISAETLSIRGVDMSDTGDKLYVLGANDTATTDAVYEYDLSTPFDITTATYSTKDLLPGGTVIEDITFSRDGTRFYTVDIGTQTAIGYTLSTAWDVTTIAADGNTLDVSGQETSPRAVHISDDGLTIYVAGGNNRIYEYTMTTAYDLSTGTYSGNNLDATSESSFIQGIHVTSNRAWVIDSSSDDVYEYELSGDISTGVYSKKLDNVNDTDPTGLAIKNDILMIAGNSSDSVYQYNFSDVYETVTGTVGLSLSRDNVLFSDVFYREVGAEGKYSDKLMWNYPGGLGYYEGFMGVRLTTTDDVEFSCDKFTVNTR